MPQAKMIDGAMFATLSVQEQKTITKAAELFWLLDSMNVFGAADVIESLNHFTVIEMGGTQVFKIVKPKPEM